MATKKITLNELREIVKQIIKEEQTTEVRILDGNNISTTKLYIFGELKSGAEIGNNHYAEWYTKLPGDENLWRPSTPAEVNEMKDKLEQASYQRMLASNEKIGQYATMGGNVTSRGKVW